MSNKDKCKKEVVDSGLISEAFIEEATEALSKYDELNNKVKKRKEANKKASNFLDVNQVYFRPALNF